MMRHVLFWFIVAGLVHGAPKVENPGFESGTFAVYPGYARQNGGAIVGWKIEGNVGINPVFAPKARQAFSDNGRIPEGRQVAFLQNCGKLSQEIAGFEPGKRYRVCFRENARHNHAPDRNPRLKVTLGGEVIVSEHAVLPVGGFEEYGTPYARVESAVFTAPRAGAFELVFETTFADRVAVLLDQITIEELPQP